MRKIIKMSLVTAVAVAGLTNANAKPLEEAIKDVDVSGTVVYRYNDYNATVDGESSDRRNFYKIGLNLSSKVNDNVKVNTRVIVGSPTDAGFVGLHTDAADGQADVTLSHVYFGYTGIKNTTVNIGKQGLTTPWTTAIDSDGNEQTGTGVLALSTWGGVTVAAGYFNQTNVGRSGVLSSNVPATYNSFGGKNLSTVAILGKVGPVALDAWYLQMSDTFDTFTIGAKSSVKAGSAKLGADVRYASLTQDANDVENTFLKVALSAKAGIFNALWVYVMTGKDGGLTALDGSAATQVDFWAVNTNNKTDADFHHLRLGVQALDTLHISANITTMDYQDVDDTSGDRSKASEQQIYAQFIYKMSKNLSTYLRYGTFEREIAGVTTVDDKYRGRLQVQYTF